MKPIQGIKMVFIKKDRFSKEVQVFLGINQGKDSLRKLLTDYIYIFEMNFASRWVAHYTFFFYM